MSLSDCLREFVQVYLVIIMQLMAWGVSLPIGIPSIANPDSTFDDCHGSPMPDDKGNGCTHGGLPNGR